MINSCVASLLLIGLTAEASLGSTIMPPVEQALIGGDWEKVRRELAGRDTKVDDPVSAVLAGYAGLATGDYPLATAEFLTLGDPRTIAQLGTWTATLVKKYPTNVVAWMLRGDALARDGKYEEALLILNKAIGLDSSNALLYDVRGVVYSSTGQLDQAIADLDKSLDLNPQLADVLVNRGITRFWRGEVDGAFTDFCRAIELAPEFALAYNSRGQLYFALEEWDAAVADFEAAGTIAPGAGWIDSNAKLALWARAQADLSRQVLVADGRGTTFSAQTLLIDGAGVESRGASPRGGWAQQLLDPGYVQINIRHEGSPLWIGPKWPTDEQNIVTLPHKWDAAAAERQLKPLLQKAWAEGKSVYLNIDANLTLPGYMAGSKTDELQWAAKVADYTLQQTPNYVHKAFSGHSAFTDVPQYMSEKTAIHNWILQSPRDYSHMDALIRSCRQTAHFDLVTGKGDAPHWGPNLHNLSAAPNVRVIELLKPAPILPLPDWFTIHGQVGQVATQGEFKISGAGLTSTQQGQLGSIVSEQLRQSRPEYVTMLDRSVPNYWISQESPLAAADVLASMVNTGGRTPLPRDALPLVRHVVVAGTGENAERLIKDLAGHGWKVTTMSAYQSRDEVESFARNVGATRIAGVINGSATPLVTRPTLRLLEDRGHWTLGLDRTPLPLSEDDWQKYRLPPPFPPDKFSGAGVPTTSYRLSSSAASGGKVGGVRMKADIVKKEKADFSALFGKDGAKESEGEQKQRSLICPFLLFCGSTSVSD